MFQDDFETAVKRALPQGTRFYSPVPSPAFGPLNGAFDIRVPVTYGYNPLALKRYSDYASAAAGNPNLLNALNVGLRVTETGAAVNPGALPKFFFPKRLHAVPASQSLPMLASTNPAESALVEGDINGITQDPAARAVVLATSEQRYVVRCQAASPSLLRAAIPWYPGWRAAVDGRPAATCVMDHAMTGVPVPAGSHEVILEYRDTAFQLGAAVTLLSLCALLGTAAWSWRRSGSGDSV